MHYVFESSASALPHAPLEAQDALRICAREITHLRCRARKRPSRCAPQSKEFLRFLRSSTVWYVGKDSRSFVLILLYLRRDFQDFAKNFARIFSIFSTVAFYGRTRKRRVSLQSHEKRNRPETKYSSAFQGGCKMVQTCANAHS